MALYDTPDGLKHIGVNRVIDVEYIRGSPYFTMGYTLYWINREKVMMMMSGLVSSIATHSRFADTKQFVILTNVIFAITRDNTIWAYNIETGNAVDYGNVSPDVRFMVMRKYGIIDHRQVFIFSRKYASFLDYGSQKIILFELPKSKQIATTKYPINEYVSADYLPDGIIDQTDDYVLYKSDGKLMVKSCDSIMSEQEVPEGSTLYRPEFIQMKSAMTAL